MRKSRTTLWSLGLRSSFSFVASNTVTQSFSSFFFFVICNTALDDSRGGSLISTLWSAYVQVSALNNQAEFEARPDYIKCGYQSIELMGLLLGVGQFFHFASVGFTNKIQSRHFIPVSWENFWA